MTGTEMNKNYIKYVQDIITEKLQNDTTLTTEQIKKLLTISGDLEILKKGMLP
jgi:hypothetical protein